MIIISCFFIPFIPIGLGWDYCNYGAACSLRKCITVFGAAQATCGYDEQTCREKATAAGLQLGSGKYPFATQNSPTGSGLLDYDVPILKDERSLEPVENVRLLRFVVVGRQQLGLGTLPTPIQSSQLEIHRAL